MHSASSCTCCGFVLNIQISFSGSLSGALLSFLLARFLLHGPVERRVQAYPTLVTLNRAMSSKGLRAVCCARCLLPYSVNNYLLGAMNTSLLHFALATFITGIPYAVVYTTAGSQLKNVETLVAGGGLSSPSGGEGVGPGLALNLFSGLAAAVAAIALVKFAKETLATEQGEEQRRRGLALESERADRPCSAVADGSSHTTLKRENNDGEKTKQKKPTQAAGQDASPPESSLLAS
eukprot:GHVT01045358.1.p1 GENE.GHVT01045358.1~~GHVT01045358.1.p1  ORF type:complete len:235 (+),score=52.30 GHVT01045358.1:828-1532(+)